MASNLGNVYKPRYRIAFLAKSKVWPYKNSRMRRFFNIRGRKLVRKGLFKRIVLVLNKMKWTVSRRYVRPISRTRRSKKREFKNSFYVKQQLKAFYGFSKEEALRSFFKRFLGGAKTRTGLFLSAIESRLDVFLFRIRFLPTIYACKQFIRYYGIRLNWDLKKKPDTKVRPGDMVVFTSPYWDHFSRSLLVRLYWRNVGLDRYKRRLFLESRYKMLWLRKKSRFYKKNFFLLAKQKRLLWKFLQLVQTFKGFSLKFENKLNDLYSDIHDSSFNFQALVDPLILETESKRQDWRTFALSYKLMSQSSVSQFEKNLELYKENVADSLDFYVSDVLTNYRVLQKSFLQNLYGITRKLNMGSLKKTKLHVFRTIFRRFRRKRLFRFWRNRNSVLAFRLKLAQRHTSKRGIQARRGLRRGSWWGFKAQPILKLTKNGWAYRKKVVAKISRKTNFLYNSKVTYKKIFRDSHKKQLSGVKSIKVRWNLRLKKRFIKERQSRELEALKRKSSTKNLKEGKKNLDLTKSQTKLNQKILLIANAEKKWYKASKKRKIKRSVNFSFWKKRPWRWLFIVAKRHEMFITKFLIDFRKFRKVSLSNKKYLSKVKSPVKAKLLLRKLQKNSTLKHNKESKVTKKDRISTFKFRTKFQKTKNFFTLNKELYWNINRLFLLWSKKKLKSKKKLIEIQKEKKKSLSTFKQKKPTFGLLKKKVFRFNRVQKNVVELKKIRKANIATKTTSNYFKKFRVYKLKKKYKYSVSFFLNRLNVIFNAYRFIYFYLNKFFKLESLAYTNLLNLVFTIKNFEDSVFSEPYKLFFKSWLMASHITLTERRKKAVALSVWFKKL